MRNFQRSFTIALIPTIFVLTLLALARVWTSEGSRHDVRAIVAEQEQTSAGALFVVADSDFDIPGGGVSFRPSAAEGARSDPSTVFSTYQDWIAGAYRGVRPTISYGLFTDNQMQQLESLEETTGKVLYANVPAWAVVVRSVNVASANLLEKDGSTPDVQRSDLVVFIDDRTGAVIMQVTGRLEDRALPAP